MRASDAREIGAISQNRASSEKRIISVNCSKKPPSLFSPPESVLGIFQRTVHGFFRIRKTYTGAFDGMRDGVNRQILSDDNGL